jgi:predicted transposase YbfD/YdcC
MNSEIDQVLEQIQKNIDEISNLDWNKINTNAPKFKVGTHVKCFETRFSKIQNIDLRKFLQELQTKKLNDIRSCFSTLHQHLKMIQDYDPENLRNEAGNQLSMSPTNYLDEKASQLLSPSPSAQNPNSFLNILDSLEDIFFNPLRLFIIEQNSPEGYKAEINKLEEQRKQYEEKFQNLQSRFDVLNSSSKDETAGIASNVMSKVFKDQADEYKQSSELWLKISISVLTIFLLFIGFIAWNLFTALSQITNTKTLIKLENYFDGCKEWKNLKSIFAVKLESTNINTKEHTENFRYYISSLDTDVQRLLDISRAHWKIESMHWILDVCFNEDDSRIRIDDAPANFSALRKIALTYLKQETTFNKGIKIKQKRAALTTDYLEAVLQLNI